MHAGRDGLSNRGFKLIQEILRYPGEAAVAQMLGLFQRVFAAGRLVDELFHVID